MSAFCFQVVPIRSRLMHIVRCKENKDETNVLLLLLGLVMPKSVPFGAVHLTILKITIGGGIYDAILEKGYTACCYCFFIWVRNMA